MKCQFLFSRQNKKNIANLSSAESAHSMVSVKQSIDLLMCLKIAGADQTLVIHVCSGLSVSVFRVNMVILKLF